MKNKLQTFATITLLPVVMLALASCSSAPPGDVSSTVITEKGVPGGMRVQTYTIEAKVTAVNAASRKVTLVTRDGVENILTAGPDVVNFGQIQVGDQVKVVAAVQLVVFMRERGEPRTDGEVAAVALAPVGAKPGGIMANTVEVTGKVAALDLRHREATLRFPDGHSKTFKVRDDIDMTKAKLGDEVVIRTTEALALSVEKP